MPDQNEILYAMELHSPGDIRKYFEAGGDPNGSMDDGRPLFTMMIEMYTRTPRFKDCVQSFIDHGLVFMIRLCWLY
jgi:hypothetical protein